MLMIDNGDGSTEELVAERFPDVRIVESCGNIGFAAGNNRLAQEARGEFLLLLNPDVVLFDNAIDALFEGRAAHPDAVAWGGVSVDAEGKPDSGNAVPVPSLSEYAAAAFGRSRRGVQEMDTCESDQQVDALMGGFVMLTRNAWSQSGGFDERYFLYCEEVDLFFRLAAMGHSFWRIAEARIHHNTGHGQGASPLRLLYYSAGSAEFMRAHWSTPKRALGLTLFWLSHLSRFVAAAILARQRPDLKKRMAAHRIVAMRPWLWIWGYDKRKGLLSQIEKSGKPLQ